MGETETRGLDVRRGRVLDPDGVLRIPPTLLSTWDWGRPTDKCSYLVIVELRSLDSQRDSD